MFEFDWDPAKAAINLRRHRVDFQLAAKVFADPNMLRLFDEDHSDFEERWNTIGLIADGRLIVVSHTLIEISSDTGLVRLISARTATPNERRQYESSQ